MPDTGTASLFEQSISHETALALGGTVLGRYPDNIETVAITGLGDKITPPWAKPLFGQFDYTVVGPTAAIDVSVELPFNTPLDHLRMFPSPWGPNLWPQYILLFTGPSSAGPWELIKEHNEAITPTPIGMPYTKVPLGGVITPHLRIVMHSAVNGQNVLTVDELEIHKPKITYDPTTWVIVSHAFDVSYRTDAAGRVVKRVAARAPARSVANDTLLLKMASGLEGVNLENSPDGTLRHTNTLCELPFDPESGTYSMKAWDGDLVRSAAFRGFNELHLEVTDAQGEPALVANLEVALGVA
jgi:hypothetical protein